MQKRLIKKTDDELSSLGFGAMRLPLKNGKIDRVKATELIYHAIDEGVNFIDTAYLYGDSEKFLGEILQGEYKNKVKLCTKLPAINIKKYEDMEKILDEQLKRLQRDSIDYYLIHSIDLKSINRLLKKDLIKFLNKAKSEGKIKHVGFSYHGSKEEFEIVVDGYDWDVVMVQYNYFDENVQAMPEDAEKIFKDANPNKSNAEWAFQWVLNNRNVTCVLSGMNSLNQLDENLKIAKNTLPMSMTFEELEVVEKVKRVMRNSLKINCSTCGYCMPCPRGVNIPECMKIYNEKYLFNHKGLMNPAFMDYCQYLSGIMGKASNAGNCNGCGKCLRKCPQNLDIISELKKVKKEFEFPGFKYLMLLIKNIGCPIYRQLLKIINH